MPYIFAYFACGCDHMVWLLSKPVSTRKHYFYDIYVEYFEAIKRHSAIKKKKKRMLNAARLSISKTTSRLRNKSQKSEECPQIALQISLESHPINEIKTGC